MKSPTDNEINHVLEQLQRTRMEIVDEWQSDAQKQGLPTVNIHDTRGAKVLNSDAVLKWEPAHLGRK